LVVWREKMWPVVKELCDNACWHVVLVRCRATGRILAYCRDCGAAWPSPAELRRDDFAIGSEHCPQGVDVPSREEVIMSLWAESVREFIPEAEYSTAAEIHESLARERTTATLGPAPRRARVDVPASLSRAWIGIVSAVASCLLTGPGGVWYVGQGSMVDRLRRAREQAEREA
jgi:hypothetical protein